MTPAPPWDLRPGANGRLAPNGFDETRFQELLTLAGPEMRSDLLSSLHRDLDLIRDRLGDGDTLTDLLQVRAQTHVLMALAGATGAYRLQRLAEELNRQARAGLVQAMTALQPVLLAALDHLIEHVARTDAEPGA